MNYQFSKHSEVLETRQWEPGEPVPENPPTTPPEIEPLRSPEIEEPPVITPEPTPLPEISPLPSETFRK